MKQNELVNKSDTSNLVNNSGLTIKLATLATKAELKAQRDKIVMLEVFDSSYLHSTFFLVMMVFKICLPIKQHLMNSS